MKDPRLDVSSESSKAEGEQEGSGEQRSRRANRGQALCTWLAVLWHLLRVEGGALGIWRGGVKRLQGHFCVCIEHRVMGKARADQRDHGHCYACVDWLLSLQPQDAGLTPDEVSHALWSCNY